MAFILRDGQKLPLALVITDADYNVLAPDGPVAWSSSDDALLPVTADAADASKAVATTVEGPGLGTATISAVFGVAGVEVTAVLDVEVVAGDASVFNIAPGTPEPR